MRNYMITIDFIGIKLHNIDMKWLEFDVRLVMTGKLDRDPEWLWDFSGSNLKRIHFWLISEGGGTFKPGDNSFNFKRGDCFITDMRKPHFARQDTKKLAVINWLVFELIDPSSGQSVTPEFWPAIHRQVTHISFLEHIMHRIVELFSMGEACHSQCVMLLKTVLIEILHSEKQQALSGEAQHNYQLIASAADLIRRFPGNRYSVRQMASHTHCTPDHFIRLFKQYQGITPNDFVLRARMEEAKHLLLFSGHSIARIADTLGYSDVSFFSRQFSKKVGMSPKQFRNGG